MGLSVNFGDFVNKTGSSLSASDYLVGFTTDYDGNRQEIRITVEDFITYIESNSANDLYTILSQNSGKWDSVYLSVSPNSGYWDSVYTTVNTVSSNWTVGGSSVSTILDYLSTNLVFLSAVNVTNNLVVSGDVTIVGNLTALGITTFTNVTYVTSSSASFNELFVTSLTATNIQNNQLNSSYSSLNANSAFWSLAYTNLVGNSSNYLTGTAVNLGNIPSLSSYWTEAYTNLVGNSSNYLTGTVVNFGNIPTLSSNWNNTYTAVSNNSANWNSTYTTLNTNSTNGISVYTSVSNNSANWNNTYTQYSQNSGTYANNTLFSNYLPTSGGTVNGDLSVIGTTYIEEIKEKVTLSASNANSTINFDLKTQSVLFLTLSSTGNWIVNFRGDNNTSLNSIMSAGQSFTCISIVSTGTTVYYNSAVQIDGITYTPYYLNGLAPQAVVSNTRALQNYAYTIIKRGNAVFNVLASVNEYY